MSAANALGTDGAVQGSLDGRPTEPSMEDILASIRRIIADDQSRQGGAQSGAPAMATPKAPPVSTTPAASLVDAAGPRNVRMPGLKPPTMPGARPTLRPSADSPAAAPVPRPPNFPHLNPPAMTPTFGFDRSLIDEIASVGVASALQASQQGVAPVVSIDPTPSAVEAGPSPSPAVPDVVLPVELPTAEPTVAARTVETAVEMPPEPEAVPAAPQAVELVAPPVSSPEPEAIAPPAAAAAPLPEPATDPLVSPEAVATIESSFHALATTVFMQNTGMVDGLVRDMMRPMLKSWLDDNLPAIVERLVRIEIERVARGGRS